VAARRLASKVETGESKLRSSSISPITIRAPGWFRTLYVGSFVAWVVLASILLFVGHSELTSAISVMFWVLAVATLPVAVSSSIRRLEYQGNKVVLVRLTGRVECPVEDLASMRASRASNGMSFCVLARGDGTLIDARGGWRTADLTDLASRLKIPLVETRRIGFGVRGFGTQGLPAHNTAPNLVSAVDKAAFIGGLRTTAGLNATWPFAGLTFTDKGFTLRLMGLVLIRGDWAYVESAQRVTGGLLRSPGVRLVLADGQRFVFWSFQPDAVLTALRVRRVQIIDPNGRPPKVWLST
jgi:hypothetical protein